MEPKNTLPKIKMQSLTPRESTPERPAPAARALVYPRQAPRARPYRPRASRRAPGKGRTWGHALAMQCMVCTLVFLMVLGIQQLELPASDELVNGLRFVVSNNARFVDESQRQVGQWMEQAVAVFAGEGALSVRQPAEGTPQRTPQGSVYTAQGPVRAVADGTVFYKGQRADGTPYVRLRHGSGYESLYEGIRTTVSVGQELWAGDIIGSISAGEELVFRLTQNGTAVDITALNMDK